MPQGNFCGCGQLVVAGDLHECGHTEQLRQRDSLRRQARTARNGYRDRTYLRNRRLALRRDRECLLCGATETLSAHHVVSPAEGGTHELDNLQTLCRRCHGQVDGGRRYVSA